MLHLASNLGQENEITTCPDLQPSQLPLMTTAAATAARVCCFFTPLLQVIRVSLGFFCYNLFTRISTGTWALNTTKVSPSIPRSSAFRQLLPDVLLCDPCVHFFSDSQLPHPMGFRLPQTPTLGLYHTRNLPWQCLGFYHCCNSHIAHSYMLIASTVLIRTMNCLCSLLRHTMWHLPVSYFTIIWWGNLEFLKVELVKRKKKFYPVLKKNWNIITMEGIRDLYYSTMGSLQMDWFN